MNACRQLGAGWAHHAAPPRAAAAAQQPALDTRLTPDAPHSLPAPLDRAAACFTCEKENCLSCVSKSLNTTTSTWNVTVTAVGCKDGAPVSWICCRDAASGCQMQAGNCLTVEGTTISYSTSTGDEKCTSVVNATFTDIKEDAEYVTLQMHDGARALGQAAECRRAAQRENWTAPPPGPGSGSPGLACSTLLRACPCAPLHPAHPSLATPTHSPIHAGNQIGNISCSEKPCCSGAGGQACRGQTLWIGSTVCEKQIWLSTCPDETPCDPETDPECQVRGGPDERGAQQCGSAAAGLRIKPVLPRPAAPLERAQAAARPDLAS